MERWIKRAVELGAGLVFAGKSDPSVIPYYPQKTEASGKEEQYFRRTTPEKRGVSSGRLIAMLSALEKDKNVNIHTLLCLKDGEVICECVHPGYEINTWHLSHSMSKTVTGIAIGMLIDDGRLELDARLCDLLPEYEYKDANFEKITVKHLLTMSTGVRFSEPGSVTESKWTESYFNSSCAFVPGADFAYNSMNSYILARIAVKLAGKSLTEFLDERLFGPLHITNRFWELGPEGIEKGGWGLYLSAESWAKIGYMMLLDGCFEGKRIISEKWVKESYERHEKAPENLGHFDYGYHLWTSKEGDSYLFNGMLGQNVWIHPQNGLVVVMMSGNNELFQNSVTRSIIEKYLAVDLNNDVSESVFVGDLSELRYAEKHFFESRHWIRPYIPRRGLGYRLGLRTAPAYPEEWSTLIGKYNFSKNNAGIMPLVVRAMQNNLSASIDSVEFVRENDSMLCVFTEGGAEYRLEIGFSDFKETVLDFHGEKYIVRVMGEAMEDEDRNMLYKLELLFPELPNTRMIKLSFTDENKLIMRMSEMPNERIAEVLLKELNGTNPKMSAYMNLIEKRIGKNVAAKRLTDTFAPTLCGARVGCEQYESIMAEQRQKNKLLDKTARVVNSVVYKLMHDEEQEDTSRGFIGEIVDRIKLKMPKRLKGKVYTASVSDGVKEAVMEQSGDTEEKI